MEKGSSLPAAGGGATAAKALAVLLQGATTVVVSGATAVVVSCTSQARISAVTVQDHMREGLPQLDLAWAPAYCQPYLVKSAAL